MAQQVIMEPSTDYFKIEEKLLQTPEDSLQLANSAPIFKEKKQNSSKVLGMITARYAPESRCDQYNSSEKFRPINLLHASKSPLSLLSHNRLHSLRLKSTAYYFIQCSLFLCSVLVHIGISHNSSSSSGIVYDQPRNPNAEFIIVTTLTIYTRNFLKKSIPYAKTIEILHDLECLLIYALSKSGTKM